MHPLNLYIHFISPHYTHTNTHTHIQTQPSHSHFAALHTHSSTHKHKHTTFPFTSFPRIKHTHTFKHKQTLARYQAQFETDLYYYKIYYFIPHAVLRHVIFPIYAATYHDTCTYLPHAECSTAACIMLYAVYNV